jgi:hypothetical protein
MQHKGKGSRALFMFSGEQFISADASVVARCILISVTKQDTTATKEAYDRCLAMRRKYSGVTAKFIQWFLNNDKEVFKNDFNKLYRLLYSNIAGRTNGERICYNLSLNHLTWRMFITFMRHHDTVSHAEAEELNNEHWNYVMSLMWGMADRCQDEQNSWVFVRVLKQLLESGEVSIKNLRGYNNDKKPQIGIVGSTTPAGQACLYPELTVSNVRSSVRDTNILGTVRSIGQLLVDQGIIVDVDTEKGQARTEKSIRVEGKRHRMWVVDLNKLGLSKESGVSPVTPEPLEFEASDHTAQKLEGLI